MTSKPYKLYYWPIPGLGEASRVALTLAKLEWEDIAIDGKMFADMKGDGTLPWGMVPLLQTPDGPLAESIAILRYLGNMCGLIPDDPFSAAKVDEFLDGIAPHSGILDGTFSIDDVEERIRVRTALFEPEAKGTKSLTLLEEKLSQSSTGWVANTPAMNIADLKIFTHVFGMFSGNFDGVDKSILSDYPNLVKYHDLVANEPRIKDHYANLPEGSLRWTYQPGAFSSL
jgi:glutathione S-transferase